MGKFSAQTMERMDQWSQAISLQGSNKHREHVCGTVLGKIAIKGMASELHPAFRGEAKENRVGGHMSKAWLQNAELARQRHIARMEIWERSGRTTFLPPQEAEQGDQAPPT